MNSITLLGPPGAQPQFPQGTQRTRPHNQAQSHVMAFQAFDIATSTPIEVGSASQKAAQKPNLWVVDQHHGSEVVWVVGGARQLQDVERGSE